MISNEGLELIHPRHYAEHGYPHQAWTTLRREAPLAYFEPLGYDSFRVVTKHADVCEVDRVLAPDGVVVWVSSSADRTPIYLPAEDVAHALPGSWSGRAALAGWGSWCVLARDSD